MHSALMGLLRVMPLRAVYAFADVAVVPVCLALRGQGRRAIYRYLRQEHGFGALKASWLTYRNHCLFAQVVIDRFAMYAGKQFQLDRVGYHHFARLEQEAAGFVQLSAHVGNYELAGYTLTSARKRFHALVFGGEKPQ